MKHTYFARQPIMDGQRRTVGYELLFRNSPQNVFPDVDADYATKSLLTDYFLGTHPDTPGKKLCSVNFPYKSLIDGTPELFPRESLLIEIQEDCPPTDELLKVIIELSNKGYKVALDNFVPSPEWKSFLPYVDMIRFDIQALPVSKVKPFVHRLYGTKIKFLAEKVETYEEFVRARKAGFHFFSGYFFCKPEMVTHKAIQASFFSVFQLIEAINKKEVNYAEVEKLITQDVTLSYKLLRYVNSSSTVTTEIKSFRQALAYLGEERLKKFVSLTGISTIKENKPDSLYSLSLQRAKLCEELALAVNIKVDEHKAFLIGLFSLLDSLLDQPLEEILESVPLDAGIRAALIERDGILGKVLTLAITYERANWEEVDRLTEELGIIRDVMKQCYESSIVWISEFFQ